MVKLCRLCAAQRKDDILTIIQDESSEICQQLRTIFRVDIRLGDSLPKLVCGECARMMRLLFSFYTKVLKSQETLKAIVEVQNPELTTTQIKEEQVESSEIDDIEETADLLKAEEESLNLKTHNGEETTLQELSATVSFPKTIERPQKAASVIIPKKEKDFEEMLQQVNINVEHCYAVLKHEVVEDFDIMPDTGEDGFFQEPDANTNHLTVSPLHLSTVEVAPTFLHREVKKAKEERVKTKMDGSVANTNFMQNDVKFAALKPNTWAEADIRSSNADVRIPNAPANPVRKSSKRQSACTRCGKLMQSRGHLEFHNRTLCGMRPFACYFCTEVFESQSVLAEHLRSHSTTPKRHDKLHKCSYCGRSFVQLDRLAAHERLHTEEPEYKCSICGVVFSKQCKLTNHMTKHISGREMEQVYFKCSVCKVAFTEKSHIDRHIKQHVRSAPYILRSFHFITP